MSPSIHYSLSAHNAASHLFAVTLQLEHLGGQALTLRLPDWIPGSYMIRDFSKNIVTLEAESAGDTVALQLLDKSGWAVPAGLDQLTLRYQVHAWDWSVRTAHLDQFHGFFNASSLFMYIEGHDQIEHRVTLLPPSHSEGRDWDVATTLPATAVDERGFGDYVATSYDALIDHPVSMAKHTRVSFEAGGVPHEMAFCGRHYADLERVARDLKPICEYQIRLFGEPAPMERYLFLVQVTENGYGGLEHRDSTALIISREHLPVYGVEKASDDYITFLGLCSHEYFHTWNVKRIKPAAFTPYRLQQENYTELLWFFEGVTSYYDDLALVRSRVIEIDQYLDLFARMITRVQRTPGRLVQSVTDSSLAAWTKFYKQDSNSPNAIVSYYAKGALVAMCLDMRLRKAGVANGLDELMQRLWQQWLDDGRGLDEQEPQALAAALAGENLDAFFDTLLYTTAELPLAESLAEVGVELSWRARVSQSDAGGKRAGDSAPAHVWLGATVGEAAGGGLLLQQLMAGGAAAEAGLAAGDRVVALAGLAVDKSNYEKVLARHGSIDSISVHYFRQGELHSASLPIKTAARDSAVLRVGDAVRVTAWLWDKPLSLGSERLPMATRG